MPWLSRARCHGRWCCKQCRCRSSEIVQMKKNTHNRNDLIASHHSSNASQFFTVDIQKEIQQVPGTSVPHNLSHNPVLEAVLDTGNVLEYRVPVSHNKVAHLGTSLHLAQKSREQQSTLQICKSETCMRLKSMLGPGCESLRMPKTPSPSLPSFGWTPSVRNE